MSIITHIRKASYEASLSWPLEFSSASCSPAAYVVCLSCVNVPCLEIMSCVNVPCLEIMSCVKEHLSHLQSVCLPACLSICLFGFLCFCVTARPALANVSVSITCTCGLNMYYLVRKYSEKQWKQLKVRHNPLHLSCHDEKYMQYVVYINTNNENGKKLSPWK